MYSSISEIKAANAAHGHFFFEPASMRFFNSKIASKSVIAGRFFITSEQFCDQGQCDPRRYTVRECLPDGRIDTVGEFQEHATVAGAKRAAQDLAAQQAQREVSP